MKTYFVKTQTSVNPHLLHSLMIKEYATTDLADAIKVFDDEVDYLSQELTPAGALDYSPTDKECDHRVYCSILAVDDDDPDDVEFIKDSDYFFEK